MRPWFDEGLCAAAFRATCGESVGLDTIGQPHGAGLEAIFTVATAPGRTFYVRYNGSGTSLNIAAQLGEMARMKANHL